MTPLVNFVLMKNLYHAPQVVALAAELVKWYRAHENFTWYAYVVDPDIAATGANGAGAVHVDGEMEAESSDGEMEA